MKRILYILTVLAFFSGLTFRSFGQGRPVYPGAETGDNPGILKIRALEGLSRRALIETPRYDADVRRSVKRPREWVEIKTTYDTAPEWIDSLTFQYYAMSRGEVDGRPAYSLYKENVTYGDIQEGREHISTAYLRPHALLRFGQLVAIAVEIRFEGTLIAYVSDRQDRDLPEDWWENKRVLNSDVVTERDGYLMDRASSPFKYINMQDYEYIRK